MNHEDWNGIIKGQVCSYMTIFFIIRQEISIHNIINVQKWLKISLSFHIRAKHYLFCEYNQSGVCRCGRWRGDHGCVSVLQIGRPPHPVWWCSSMKWSVKMMFFLDTWQKQKKTHKRIRRERDSNMFFSLLTLADHLLTSQLTPHWEESRFQSSPLCMRRKIYFNNVHPIWSLF